MLPNTMPPPNTLFNSASVVIILFSSALLTSLIEIVFQFSSTPLNSFHSSFFFLSVPFTITSSTKVFHLLQPGHLPIHFALSYPQFWQKKLILFYSCCKCIKVRLQIENDLDLRNRREIIL